ncbi:intracellular proteinase inhibitor [Bacillus sp. FJAT-49705]|uniref:Intracellular proteinase inhibitor n=1 Tax=Cytobacillus citreus TaxID=2833586 RepID=A0ABS5NN41_9BACI|nr:intracellular proteinase inhibitor [Cytobacillus citreus]MBS4188843.1 intracellular proteinase inhibitor [Cytobacillus citreus]
MLQVLMAFILVISASHYYTGILMNPIESNERLQDNEVFRMVKVRKENMKYKITGEFRLKKGEFFYVVEDGHDELIPATKKKVEPSFPNWSKFEMEIHIPKEKLPNNGTLILYFFEENNENQRIHTLPIILERS